jgi:hypothetical protein
MMKIALLTFVVGIATGVWPVQTSQFFGGMVSIAGDMASGTVTCIGRLLGL